jgi:citrate synthase
MTLAAPDVAVPKPKKSVALSGIVAGNTALCTVGRTGNDLHYRGYDILDIADSCEFEEIAYLLVHGKLPTGPELSAYKTKLRTLRGVPEPVREILERLPAAAHPMDVMRTAVSALGTVLPEKHDHGIAGARDIADRLIASLGSMLLYWYHWSHNGKRIDVETVGENEHHRAGLDSAPARRSNQDRSTRCTSPGRCLPARSLPRGASDVAGAANRAVPADGPGDAGEDADADDRRL